jgi:hypothetical protein
VYSNSYFSYWRIKPYYFVNYEVQRRPKLSLVGRKASLLVMELMFLLCLATLLSSSNAAPPIPDRLPRIHRSDVASFNLSTSALKSNFSDILTDGKALSVPGFVFSAQPMFNTTGDWNTLSCGVAQDPSYFGPEIWAASEASS